MLLVVFKNHNEDLSKEDLEASAEIVLLPALKGVYEMTIKEEEILFTMMMDTLANGDWCEIQKQSLEIGYCLYDPQREWKPEGIEPENINTLQKEGGNIQLPTGGFSAEELLAILNTLPVDITFVDRNDKVKYFSQSSERIFQRNHAILNRDVRYCHPPASGHIVDKILDDFKSGVQTLAPFWINMGGKMVHIEYFALRNNDGEYLATLEVSQYLTGYLALESEQRIFIIQINKAMEANEILIITPKTKVLQLIEAYPKLEDVLIRYVIAFKKLKNPVLRNTVAKITTLQQAASIGNIKVEELINVLCKEVGQDLLSLDGDSTYNNQKPNWFDETKISKKLDISEMLAAGEHPFNQVIADLRSLSVDSIYKTRAPIIPAPFIDKATSLGFAHWDDQQNVGKYFVYFMLSTTK